MSEMMSEKELVELFHNPPVPEDPDRIPLDTLFTLHYDSVCDRLEYYRFLYWLVRRMQPKVSVELGVEYGIASAHMAAAASHYGGIVIGVDHQWHGTPGDEVKKLWPNYRFIVGDTVKSAGMVQTFVKHHGPIGLLFQDSSHHYAHSCLEWDVYRTMMVSGSLWVCDDVTPAFFEKGVDAKSMEEYFDERPGIRFKFPYARGGNTIGVIKC